MKLFLSSTTRDLSDARSTFIKDFEGICENRIELVSFEKYSPSSALCPEDTCFDLVKKCQGLMLFLDRYYGTKSKRDDSISITHAEVREALKLGLHVIPVVRNPTWYEFLVWQKNKGIPIVFNHVEEPKLFYILEELFNEVVCMHYDDFTSRDTMNKIAEGIINMIDSGGLGLLDHMSLG